jgi:hypothetical protein
MPLASKAWARVIGGTMVGSRRASLMAKIKSYRDRHNFTFRLFA